MSFFSEASLAMIPSGYKTSKVYSAIPTSGDGDLTFSRSNDTATRVGPDGLIEKVRTNLLLQSNSFDTTWVQTNTTLTSGQSGYDGSSDAWKVEATTTDTTRLYQSSSISANTLITISLYAKVGNVDFIKFNLATSGTNSIVTFDLTDGTTSASNAIDTAWEEVGSGWVRISATFINVDIITEPRIEVRSESNNATADAGSFVYIQDAQLETGDIATDYIATTTAAVSVGPVANVPRLDYLDSSSPRLLLEPQRTNLFQYSEQLNTGTSGATATPNQAVSPDGYTNADLITGAGANNYIAKSISGAFTGTHTFSIFLKSGTDSAVGLDIYDGTYYNATYNLATGVATGTGASMVSYGNGWYRCILTRTTSANPVEVSISSIGDGLTIYAWGGQFEADSAYATSYIPTLGAAVTRGADSPYKTGISSLIGQTEGTIYWETQVDTPSATGHETFINVDNGSFSDTIYMYKTAAALFIAEVYDNGVLQATFTKSGVTAGIHKLAIGYANNNTAFFVDGVQVGSTDTSCSVPTMSRIQLGQNVFGTSTDKTAQVLLFPTRLSNADLASLTSL